jgi:membrane-bound lytic murein transglycosylase B
VSATPLARRRLRTDTLEVGDVPAPGQTGLAKPTRAAAGALTASANSWGATTASGARWTPAEGVPAAEAAVSRTAPAEGAAGARAAAGARGGTPEAAGSRDPRSQLVSDMRSGGLLADKATLSKAASILAAAKLMKTGGLDFSSPKALENSIVEGAMQQAKADLGVKAALGKLEASGKPVTEEQRQQAAAGALAASGLPSDAQAADEALGRQNNAAPPPTLAQVRAVAHDVASHPPDPAAAARIAQESEKPRPLKPLGNPMKAREVAEKYKDALCAAASNHGVPPHLIMGLLSVETDFGRDMGKERLTDALQVRANKGIKQAVSDLRSLPASIARGDYGGLKASEIRSNAWGAICYPQFLASSVLSLGESASGARAVNVCDMSDAIASAANYLDRSGYRASPDKAIFAYNHSAQYVKDVKDRAAAMQKEAPVKCP